MKSSWHSELINDIMRNKLHKDLLSPNFSRRIWWIILWLNGSQCSNNFRVIQQSLATSSWNFQPFPNSEQLTSSFEYSKSLKNMWKRQNFIYIKCFPVFQVFIYTCFPNFSTKLMFAHCSTTSKKTQLMCYGWTDCGRTFSSLMPGGHYGFTQQSIPAWYHQFQNFTVLPHTYSS
jgi:hypothetical protein